MKVNSIPLQRRISSSYLQSAQSMGSTTGKLRGAQGCPQTPKVSKLSAFPAMSPLLAASWAGVGRSCHIPAALEWQEHFWDEESQSREEGALTGISFGGWAASGSSPQTFSVLPTFPWSFTSRVGVFFSQGGKLWLVKILRILDWCHNPAQVICEGTQAKEFTENCPRNGREPNQDGAEFSVSL